MDAAILAPFLKFAHNPASWIDESYRPKLASGTIPAGLLVGAWRRNELSSLLESCLELGGTDSLSEGDLKFAAARIALMETGRFQDLLVYAGVCFCRDSLRKLISKAAINSAKQELGDEPVDFARLGNAAEIFGDVPDDVKLPVFKHSGWSKNTAIAAGFGLWHAAADGLHRQWTARVRYKVPAGCHELAECERTRMLPKEFSAGLLVRLAAHKAGDLQWLQ